MPSGAVYVAGKTETYNPGTAIAELDDNQSGGDGLVHNDPWTFSGGSTLLATPQSGPGTCRRIPQQERIGQRRPYSRS